MLDYFLLLIISFLGLLIGLVIGYLAKEELKPGIKYLSALKYLTLALIIILFCLKNLTNALVIAFVAIILLRSYFSKFSDKLFYASLAIMLFLSWALAGVSLIAPLIFAYGLSLGSIYLHDHIKDEKNKKKILAGLFKEYFIFLAAGLLLGILGLFL